jgi:hypothetical protein
MRKDKIFLCGIAFAFALVLGSCPASAPAPVPDEYKGLGEKLNLSGRVYTPDIDTGVIPPQFKYNAFEGDLDLDDGGLGGSGEIRNGRLSYAIQRPLSLLPIDDGLTMLEEVYANVSYSSQGVNANVISFSILGGAYSQLLLEKKEALSLQLPLTVKFPAKIVSYVYVDNDVTVTAKGKVSDFTDFGFPMNLTTENTTLNLKKGWNPLCASVNASADLSSVDLLSMDLSTLDLADLDLKGTMCVSVDNPLLNWTLY